MDTSKMELTGTQRSTISNSLRVAADRFDEHVKTLIDMYEDNQRLEPGYKRLAEQFQQQARDSRQLASLFDECETVVCQSASLIESF
jgi:type II secretory pathway component PulF